jgi:hypothetical protein
MARIVKNQEKWHKLTVKDEYGGEMILMGTGRSAQLSIWAKKDNFAYMSGPKTLRALAHAILKATTTRKRRADNGPRDL